MTKLFFIFEIDRQHTRLYLYLICLSVFAVGKMNAQPWTYDFGTGTGTYNTASSSSTSFFATNTAAPPTNGGTYVVRIGTQGGSANLVSSTISTTGSMFSLNACTGSTSPVKFGVYDWTSPSAVAYTKFKMSTTSTGDGKIYFRLGKSEVATKTDGATFPDIANNFNYSIVWFCITYASSSISSVSYLQNTNATNPSQTFITTHYFVKNTTQDIEVYANSANTGTTYYRNGVPVTLNAKSWDLWVDSHKIVDGASPTTTNWETGTNINGFAFYGESSTSNRAWLYIDDLEYSNALPSCNIEPTVDATDYEYDETENSVALSSAITDLGDCPITDYGFVYGTSPNPELETGTKVQVGTEYLTSNTPFEKTIEGLNCEETHYYIRAYATNGKGTSYSDDDIDFTTTAVAEPTITLSDVGITTTFTRPCGGIFDLSEYTPINCHSEWTFEGWVEGSEVVETTNRPTFIADPTNYIVNKNVTLYAVYTKDVLANVYSLATSVPTGNESEKYIIVYSYSGGTPVVTTTKALKLNTSGDTQSAADVTINETLIDITGIGATPFEIKTSTINSSHKTIKSSDGYYLYSDNNSTNNLKATTTLRSDCGYGFTIAASNIVTITAAVGKKIWYTGSGSFGGTTGGTNYIYLYKQKPIPAYNSNPVCIDVSESAVKVEHMGTSEFSVNIHPTSTNRSHSKTFTIECAADVSRGLAHINGSVSEFSAEFVAQSAGAPAVMRSPANIVSKDILVTYAPELTGTHQATLTLSAAGADAFVINLIGTATDIATGVITPQILRAIYTLGNSVVITATEGEIIEIYNPLGQQLARLTAQNGENRISVPSGVLLVKVGSETHKIVKN